MYNEIFHHILFLFVFFCDIFPYMTHNMDKIDRRLLQLLQDDASGSIEELADTVNLSRNACWRRIKQLETAGIIRKRVVLVEPDQVNLELSAYVMIKTHSHETVWMEQFRTAISTMPEIVGAYRMSGDLDYILKVRIENVRAYDEFYKRLVNRVKLAEVSASFVMDDLKDTTALPI